MSLKHTHSWIQPLNNITKKRSPPLSSALPKAVPFPGMLSPWGGNMLPWAPGVCPTVPSQLEGKDLSPGKPTEVLSFFLTGGHISLNYRNAVIWWARLVWMITRRRGIENRKVKTVHQTDSYFSFYSPLRKLRIIPEELRLWRQYFLSLNLIFAETLLEGN